MVITSAINIDMQYKYVNTYVDAVQYDVNSRNVEITLLKAGSRADIPTGSTFEVKFKRPDGSSGSYSELSNGQAAVTKKETNVIVVWLSEFILSEAGATVVSVCVKDGETEVNTFSFIVNVQESPHIGTGLARMYPNTYDATATPSDIAFGKTAYVKGEKILGTSVQAGDGSGTITPPSLGDPEYLIVNGYMGLSEAKKALARRNIDAVASVNGRTPDSNGNVDLTTMIPPTVNAAPTAFVTPQMHGAKGDGVTDDTDAFRSAVATGMPLYIPAGNYYVTETLSYSGIENVKIVCDGSIHMKSQDRQTNLFNITACNNVEIIGLNVESTRDKIGESPAGHTRPDYSSSNVVPFAAFDCGYVTVRDCEFTNPDYGFLIRGLLDDSVEVKTKVVIDNVTVKNACMGCFVDRLKEFNISNSAFYMAEGVGKGDHAIYATRYIEKVNIDSCYFFSSEDNTEIGPMIDMTAYDTCVQNANISKCVFDCRVGIYFDGYGKCTVSDCNVRSYSYFVRTSGYCRMSINNCVINSNADVISPGRNTDGKMSVHISDCDIQAVSMYMPESGSGTTVDIITSDCNIKTSGYLVYSSEASIYYRFVNVRWEMTATESMVRYYHTNLMEFIGCKFVSPRGLLYCKNDIAENNIVLISCLLESPSLYRSTEPTNKATCYNSYLNGELLDRPYVTEKELIDKGFLTSSTGIVLESNSGNEYQLYVKDNGLLTTKTLSDNLVKLAVDTDGSIYNGVGYKENHRLNSSATVVSEANAIVSGYIPITLGTAFEASGSTTDYVAGGNYVAFYDRNFELIVVSTFSNIVQLWSATYTYENGVYKLTLDTDNVTYDISDVAYFRISMANCTAENFVVTSDTSGDTTPIVESVNGKTGAVELTAEDVGALPADYTETDPTVPAWAKAATKPSYSKSEVGLGNVDNVKQYSASNPPPYPVTSVNGKTGAVTINIPTKTSALTNDSGFITASDIPEVQVPDLSGYALKSSAETWTFTLADGSTVTKKVVLA